MDAAAAEGCSLRRDCGLARRHGLKILFPRPKRAVVRPGVPVLVLDGTVPPPMRIRIIPVRENIYPYNR